MKGFRLASQGNKPKKCEWIANQHDLINSSRRAAQKRKEKVEKKKLEHVDEGRAEYYDNWHFTYSLHSFSSCMDMCTKYHNKDQQWNGCVWLQVAHHCSVCYNARGFLANTGCKHYKWM